MECEQLPFPIELWETNYDYPDVLFDDRLMRFDGCDDEVLIPVEAKDKPLLMARFAVVNELGLPNEESTKVKLARNEIEHGFISGIRKVWRGYYDTKDGLEKGDIEITAEVLGVYDLVFPCKPTKKMLRTEAEEKRLEERLCADAEMLADAYDRSSDDHLVGQY